MKLDFFLSYSLKSKIDFDTWNDLVSSLNHTLGFKKFSDYQLESSIGLDNQELVVGLTTNLTAYEHAFAQQLQKAIDNKEITNGRSAIELARFCVMGIYGLRTYALTNQDPDALNQLANELLAAIS